MGRHCTNMGQEFTNKVSVVPHCVAKLSAYLWDRNKTKGSALRFPSLCH